MIADPSKSLPYAPDAERAVLSLAVQDALGVMGRGDITPAHFHDPTHREFWVLMDKLHTAGRPVDLATISIALTESGRMEAIGGPSTVAEICNASGLAGNYSYYVSVLADKLARREAWAVTSKAAAAMLDESQPISSALEDAHNSLANLSVLTGNIGRPSRLSLADLDARRIKLESPPTKPVPVLTLQGQQVCTAGNLTVLSAQVKSGKSAAVGAIIAATLAADTDNEEADTFGFVGSPTGGKAVIHFDTEQSPYDAWQLIRRACNRAGVKTLPTNYRAYSLCDIPTEKRRAFLAEEMERASVECGGIHLVTIDGIADLVRDPNDIPEAFGLVEKIFQLAVQYACPIISVLHENPSTTGGSKTRGHLGSELERKAESNLRLVKAGEVTTIFSEKCRSASLPQSQGAKFKWCDHAGMHVTVEADTVDSRRDRKRVEEAEPCNEAFEGTVGSISHGTLRGRVESICGVKSRTAEKRIAEWVAIGLIKKGSEKGYVKA